MADTIIPIVVKMRVSQSKQDYKKYVRRQH